MSIYFSSDLHFGHNKEFLYKPRGFNCIEDMNAAIVENFNSVVKDEDDLYLLGDLMLGDYEIGKFCLESLKGKKHIIIGNHDTDNRVQIYKDLGYDILGYASMFKYQKYHFYLSHYPTLTANFDDGSLKKCVINLYGHTHQQNNFFNEKSYMYHVGVDSHDCYPISIEQIIEDCKNKKLKSVMNNYYSQQIIMQGEGNEN